MKIDSTRRIQKSMKTYFPCRFPAMLIPALALFSCIGPTSPTDNRTLIDTVGGVSFTMHLVPAAASFPTGIDDTGTGAVDAAFWMAETEVTYQLWEAVYLWATDDDRGTDQYHFQNAGMKGNSADATDQHPVTLINWRDVMVWCNALTEYDNVQNGGGLACVYTYNGAVVRDAGNANATACDNTVAAGASGGFRLPTSMEWVLAARYRDGSTWTPGSYASGAAATWTDAAATQAVAWYIENSGGVMHQVGQKNANALRLYDMSGNVDEWCADAITGYGNLIRPLIGGSWNITAEWLQLGHDNVIAETNYATSSTGFRLARNY
jgi:sulfatase modifying factor 1